MYLQCMHDIVCDWFMLRCTRRLCVIILIASSEDPAMSASSGSIWISQISLFFLTTGFAGRVSSESRLPCKRAFCIMANGKTQSVVNNRNEKSKQKVRCRSPVRTDSHDIMDNYSRHLISSRQLVVRLCHACIITFRHHACHKHRAQSSECIPCL